MWVRKHSSQHLEVCCSHKKKKEPAYVSHASQKEISEWLRARVVELHEAGRGYKLISRRLHLHPSTVRQTVYRWIRFRSVVSLPRSGRPARISPRTQHRIIREVKKTKHFPIPSHCSLQEVTLLRGAGGWSIMGKWISKFILTSVQLLKLRAMTGVVCVWMDLRRATFLLNKATGRAGF